MPSFNVEENDRWVFILTSFGDHSCKQLGCGTYWEIGSADYVGIMDTKEMAEKAQNWQEKAQEYTDKARDWQRTATETARNTGRVIHEYVHENTWISIAIAAAVGCAIGLLLSRDSD